MAAQHGPSHLHPGLHLLQQLSSLAKASLTMSKTQESSSPALPILALQPWDDSHLAALHVVLKTNVVGLGFGLVCFGVFFVTEHFEWLRHQRAAGATGTGAGDQLQHRMVVEVRSFGHGLEEPGYHLLFFLIAIFLFTAILSLIHI